MRPFPRSRALWLLALLGFFAYDARAQLSTAAPVRVGETVVFTLSAPHGPTPATERARQASLALAEVVQGDELPEVRVQRSAEIAIVYAGEAPIIELIEADATLAGETSLDAHADKSANLIRQALASEHKRSRIAETVFSLSLVILFALIAFYLIKKLASVAERLRIWLEEHGDRRFVIRVKSIELVRPAVLKNTAIVALGLLKWVGQFGIFYAWLVVVLSLFETTRGYTERLTGFVLAPLSQLMSRALHALPMLVGAGFVALAVFILMRFTGLFMASVARRETSLAWLPADLAQPASVLLRICIVLGALVFAAPIVTGSTEGSLGRTGAVVLVALGLAATPLFASGLLGAVVLFGRRLAVGEYVQIQGRLGRIASINLLELRLQTSDGTEQRIPHLLLLAHSIERMGPAPRLSVEVVVPTDVAPARVLELLTAAGERTGRDASAELVSVEPVGARYRVTATCSSLSGRSPLLQGVVEALAATGVSVGQGAARARPG
jgi:small-conductance mechanosensitive channel